MMKFIFEQARKNPIGMVLGVVYSTITPILYYLTGEMAFVVTPVDNLFGGRYVLVIVAFGLTGLILGSFVEVKLKWPGR